MAGITTILRTPRVLRPIAPALPWATCLPPKGRSTSTTSEPTPRSIELWWPGGYFLPFQVAPQLESEWCWAAVSTSVAHYYTPSSGVTQCQVVNEQLGRTDCCINPGSNDCNQPGYLDQALQYVGHFASDKGQGSYGDLSGALAAGEPPCLRIGWSGGGGHFIGVYGCEGGDIVLVTDPIYGDSFVTVGTLTGGSYEGSGTWTNTYFTQA